MRLTPITACIAILSAVGLAVLFFYWNDKQQRPEVSNIDLKATSETTSLVDSNRVYQDESSGNVFSQSSDQASQAIAEQQTVVSLRVQNSVASESQPLEDSPRPNKDSVIEQLRSDDIEYVLSLSESNYFDVKGVATSTVGDIAFDSKLLPSNEVILQLTIEREGADARVFDAYFDLANYVMELDGKNAILNEEDKELLRISSEQITYALLEQHEGYDVPEQGTVLVRMMSYWSNSPEGFVHEKHGITSR